MRRRSVRICGRLTGTDESRRGRVGRGRRACAALVAILLPVALIFLGSWADTWPRRGGWLNQTLHLLGSPDIAMLIAVLVALVTLGGHIPNGAASWAGDAAAADGGLVCADCGRAGDSVGGGGLSGVLRDSGAAQATVGLALGAHMPPLVLAWALAAVVRVCMGSATVAMAVASGVLAPMAGHMGVKPEMLVLATGMRVADSVARERLGVLAGEFVVQAGREGDAGDVVGDGDGSGVSGLGITLLLSLVVR